MSTRRERIILDLNANPYLRGLGTASTATTAFADKGSRDIDRFSGRLRLLADTAAVLGPALVPIGAVGVPAVTGLAAQFGFAAVAGGSLIAAAQGVGDALTAMEEARLDPTVENLEKAREAMQQLSPAARDFAVALQDFLPTLRDIRDAGASGWFPGLTEALDHLEVVGPKVADIFEEVGRAGGDLAAAGAESLAGPRWAEFFEFVETNAPQALTELGQTVGNLVHGMAELWMAFDPLNDDFSGWLLDVSASFDAWSQGLSQTEGFREFVDYIAANGPRVADALGALGNALLQIVEAAAPLGGVVLTGVEAFADAVAAIADSGLGTPIMAAVGAMALLNRATAIYAATGAKAFVGTVRGANGAVAAMGAARTAAVRGSAGVALLGLSLTDMDDKLGINNTAMLSMAGLMVGGPWGFAIGTGAGALMDLASATDDSAEKLEGLDAAMQSGSAAKLRREIAPVREELRQLGREAALHEGLWAGIGAMWSDVTGETDRLERGLGRAERRLRMLDDAAGRTEGLDYLLGQPLGLAREFDVATDSMEQFSRSFKRLNGLLSDSQSLIDYERALDELWKSLDDAPKGKAFTPDFEAGRQQIEQMNELISTAIARAEVLKERGKDLAATRMLTRALEDLESFGKKSPALKAAAEEIRAELRRLNGEEAEPKIDADVRGFRQALRDAGISLKAWDSSKGDATLDADPDPFYAELGRSERQMHEWDILRATAELDANASGFFGIFGQVRSALAAFDGSSATAHVYVQRHGGTGGLGAVPGYANGGLVLPFERRGVNALADELALASGGTVPRGDGPCTVVMST